MKIAPFRFAFRANLSPSAIHRRCALDPLEQIAQRCHLQPATSSQVGPWHMRTRLKGSRIAFSGLAQDSLTVTSRSAAPSRLVRRR